MDTPPTGPLVVIADEVMSLAPVSPLWACAVPGTGPEYRFTGTAGGPLRRLRAVVRRRRTARTMRRASRELQTRYRVVQDGGRSC